MFNDILGTIAQIKRLVGNDPNKAAEELRSINPKFKEFSERPIEDICNEYHIDIDMVRKMIG